MKRNDIMNPLKSADQVSDIVSYVLEVGKLDKKQNMLSWQWDSGDTVYKLYDLHKELHFKYCCRLTGSKHDAEDLFQEAWIRVMKNIGSFDASKPFKNWLFKITTNLYRDDYRKAKRRIGSIAAPDKTAGDSTESGYADLAGSVEEQVEDKELKVRLIACLNSLDDKYKIPLVLFYFKEVSYGDMVEILNIPMGTLKTRLNKGKKIIYEMIGGYRDE